MTPPRAALVAVVLAASLAGVAGAAPADDPAPAILHMLDYVAVDYAEAVRDGAVVDAGEYEEQIEFVSQARALLDRLPPQPARARDRKSTRLNSSHSQISYAVFCLK